jgi:hypothetical protein
MAKSLMTLCPTEVGPTEDEEDEAPEWDDLPLANPLNSEFPKKCSKKPAYKTVVRTLSAASTA